MDSQALGVSFALRGKMTPSRPIKPSVQWHGKLRRDGVLHIVLALGWVVQYLLCAIHGGAGMNSVIPATVLFVKAVFSRPGGYEDVNVTRLGRKPTM